MRKPTIISVIVLSALLLQGCSVTYYRLRSQIPAGPSAKKGATCPSKYSLAIKRYGKFITLGERKELDSAEQFNRYVKATEDVFTKKGCDAEYTESPDEADFRIQVVVSPVLSALPNERLTLYSLGLIPSWGTREGEFEYTFENTTAKKSLTYFIDRPVCNHIVFFPVFWLSFIFLEETGPYKTALTNFVENSKASLPRDKQDTRTQGASLSTGPHIVSLQR